MHTSSTVVLLLAVFGASLVEMVEALTIVVAAGVSRGWRSALLGAGAAVLVLGVLVVAVGVPLVRYIPIDALRVIMGALLLVLGLNWLRKAILRASGHKSLHDEDEIYAGRWPTRGAGRRTGGWAGRAGRRTGGGAGPAGPHRGYDSVGFAVAFKGVFFGGHRGGLDRDQPRSGPAPLRAWRRSPRPPPPCWWPPSVSSWHAS